MIILEQNTKYIGWFSTVVIGAGDSIKMVLVYFHLLLVIYVFSLFDGNDFLCFAEFENKCEVGFFLCRWVTIAKSSAVGQNRSFH